ncbi:MAG: Inner rane component of cytoplasmic domain, partial [Pseudomonadota bacterium]
MGLSATKPTSFAALAISHGAGDMSYASSIVKTGQWVGAQAPVTTDRPVCMVQGELIWRHENAGQVRWGLQGDTVNYWMPPSIRSALDAASYAREKIRSGDWPHLRALTEKRKSASGAYLLSKFRAIMGGGVYNNPQAPQVKPSSNAPAAYPALQLPTGIRAPALRELAQAGLASGLWAVSVSENGGIAVRIKDSAAAATFFVSTTQALGIVAQRPVGGGQMFAHAYNQALISGVAATVQETAAAVAGLPRNGTRGTRTSKPTVPKQQVAAPQFVTVAGNGAASSPQVQVPINAVNQIVPGQAKQPGLGATVYDTLARYGVKTTLTPTLAALANKYGVKAMLQPGAGDPRGNLDAQIERLAGDLKPGESIVIGRSLRADVQLGEEHGMVSGFHAKLTKRPDGLLELSDLNSRNGSWLDSGTGACVRIKAPLTVRPGTKIKLGWPDGPVFTVPQLSAAAQAGQLLPVPVASSIATSLQREQFAGRPDGERLASAFTAGHVREIQHVLNDGLRMIAGGDYEQAIRYFNDRGNALRSGFDIVQILPERSQVAPADAPFYLGSTALVENEVSRIVATAQAANLKPLLTTAVMMPALWNNNGSGTQFALVPGKVGNYHYLKRLIALSAA